MKEAFVELDLPEHEPARNLRWIPVRATTKEFIDTPDQPLDALRETFRDVRTVNRFLGGTSLVLAHIAELVGNSKAPVSILDVGTGTGDIPRALLKWAKRRGVPLHIVASDASPAVLGLATEAREDPNLVFAVCDAISLPFKNEKFDFVVSSLTFHHFDDATARQALSEMNRVASRALIVNDLRRAYLPAALIWLLTRILGMHRLTRHDAPLSVLRARTLGEYKTLAKESHLPECRIYRHAFWRAAIVARKPA